MSLGRRVLFSPVGTTDPVRGGYDGSMLHIVRHYQPDKVYLYYTKEMAERDETDNKCEQAIKMLRPGTRVEKFFGETEPHDFDGFIAEFNRIINIISTENPGIPIILNISSGTPQMKSTLCLEAVTSNKEVKAVQVATPKKGANVDSPVLDKEQDIYEIMENNLDSLEDAENRCMEPRILSFRHSMLKSQIQSLIEIYDYEGAIRLADEFDNPQLKRLINHCRLRLNLKSSAARKEIDSYNGVSLFPVSDARAFKLAEYLLTLKIKQKKEKLTDMVLGLNPFVVELLMEYSRIVLKIDTEEFQIEMGTGEIKVIRSKIAKADPKLLAHLDDFFQPGGLKDSASLSIDFLCGVITYGAGSDKVDDKRFFESLRKLNSKLRNSSAHSLQFVNDEDIRACTGMTGYKLIKKLEGVMKNIYKEKLDQSIFSIYDRANGFITEELNKY